MLATGEHEVLGSVWEKRELIGDPRTWARICRGLDWVVAVLGRWVQFRCLGGDTFSSANITFTLDLGTVGALGGGRPVCLIALRRD